MGHKINLNKIHHVTLSNLALTKGRSANPSFSSTQTAVKTGAAYTSEQANRYLLLLLELSPMCVYQEPGEEEGGSAETQPFTMEANKESVTLGGEGRKGAHQETV